MNAGLPVVVAEIGAASWIAQDAGVTFQNGNVASLRDALTRLLSNPKLREQLGQKGRTRARTFDVKVIGPQLIAELESLTK